MIIRDNDYDGPDYPYKGWTIFELKHTAEKRLCFYDKDYVWAPGKEWGKGHFRPTPEVEKWLNENCTGGWKFFQFKVVFEFLFEKVDDAMLFKLAWR